MPMPMPSSIMDGGDDQKSVKVKDDGKLVYKF
jgi:hypothetical protein